MNETRTRRRLGMSPWLIVGLAALGVPRVVAHDLGPVGTVPNALLVFVPVLIWLAVAWWRRVPNAFVTLLAIGVAYGVLLGLVHQVLWDAAFDRPPRLGGNLAGQLSPALEAVVIRLAAFFSSLVTGVGVGVAAGAVGWALGRVAPRR